jgi:hypothetical protein
MRLEIGGRVDCSDDTSGELADVVIDSTTKRVTHLVVKAQGEPWAERLVPVELESQLALAELESRHDDVARRLREMRTASDEIWRERRERADAALDEREHAAEAL